MILYERKLVEGSEEDGTAVYEYKPVNADKIDNPALKENIEFYDKKSHDAIVFNKYIKNGELLQKVYHVNILEVTEENVIVEFPGAENYQDEGYDYGFKFDLQWWNSYYNIDVLDEHFCKEWDKENNECKQGYGRCCPDHRICDSYRH